MAAQAAVAGPSANVGIIYMLCLRRLSIHLLGDQGLGIKASGITDCLENSGVATSWARSTGS